MPSSELEMNLMLLLLLFMVGDWVALCEVSSTLPIFRNLFSDRKENQDEK